MASLKSVDSAELNAKLAQLTASKEALQKAKVEVPQVILDELEAVTKELSTRIGDVIASKISAEVDGYLKTKLKETTIEGTVELRLSIKRNAETGEIESEISAAKKARSASSGGGGQRSGFTRKAVMWNGVQYDSAAACLKAAIEAKALQPGYGAGNSAVRVLESLKKNNASFASLEFIEVSESPEEDAPTQSGE